VRRCVTSKPHEWGARIKQAEPWATPAANRQRISLVQNKIPIYSPKTGWYRKRGREKFWRIWSSIRPYNTSVSFLVWKLGRVTIMNIYSQYYFISFFVIHLFVTRTNLYHVSFTKQASNESEINGPGKKKPKLMRQQSTEKYLLQSYRTWSPECLSHVGKTFGRITIFPFSLKLQIVTVKFAA